jgi:protein disulfide-isomerase
MKTLLFTLTLFISNLIWSQNWITDINLATAESDSTGKPLLILFTGSDWCSWCIRLQKEVFTKPEFLEWAKDNVVLVEIDFPRNKIQSEELKKQNQLLQQQFNIQGYPTAHFVTKTDGVLNSIGITGYLPGGATNWIENANSIILE